MTNPAIPPEAIEAAVHAYMQYPRTRGLDNTENMFRAALEAAAPCMQAGSAWHDAVSEAYVEGALSAEQANVMWAKNPYRRTE